MYEILFGVCENLGLINIPIFAPQIYFELLKFFLSF